MVLLEGVCTVTSRHRYVIYYEEIAEGGGGAQCEGGGRWRVHRGGRKGGEGGSVQCTVCEGGGGHLE